MVGGDDMHTLDRGKTERGSAEGALALAWGGVWGGFIGVVFGVAWVVVGGFVVGLCGWLGWLLGVVCVLVNSVR